jgi:hypothetical protein
LKKYRRDSNDHGCQQRIRANVLAGNPAIDVQDMAKHSRGQYGSESYGQEIPEPETPWVHPTVLLGEHFRRSVSPKRSPNVSLREIAETIKRFSIVAAQQKATPP